MNGSEVHRSEACNRTLVCTRVMSYYVLLVGLFCTSLQSYIKSRDRKLLSVIVTYWRNDCCDKLIKKIFRVRYATPSAGKLWINNAKSGQSTVIWTWLDWTGPFYLRPSKIPSLNEGCGWTHPGGLQLLSCMSCEIRRPKQNLLVRVLWIYPSDICRSKICKAIQEALYLSPLPAAPRCTGAFSQSPTN